MELELKTSSLKEIIKKCESLGLDINKVKIEGKIFEDFGTCEEFVKLYLKYNKKRK